MSSLQITELKQRFDALSSNDRIALSLLSLFVAALFVVYMLILPAHRFANDAADQHQQSAELLAWMQANEAAARVLAPQPAVKTTLATGQSILSLASQQAQANNISFKRFEPFAEGGLRIWLDNVPFNNMLQWLTQLQENYGVQVNQLSVDRSKGAGTVTAKLELFLPS